MENSDKKGTYKEGQSGFYEDKINPQSSGTVNDISKNFENERKWVGLYDSTGNQILDGDYIGKNGKPLYRMFIEKGSQRPMMHNLSMHFGIKGTPNPISPIYEMEDNPHLSYPRVKKFRQEWINDCKFVIIKNTQNKSVREKSDKSRDFLV